VTAHPIEGGQVHVFDGEARGMRIDFPRADFVRFGSRLAKRA
jgi:hypothetical protein